MKIGIIRSLKRLFGKNLIALFYRSLSFLSDENYVKTIYRLRLGRKPDLANPRTFTEKLQWLKIHDHNPIHTRMADKIGMRDYVESLIGPGHTVPLIGVWESWEDIDLEGLPERFVLKTSHDSGSYCICTDKGLFDADKAKKTIKRSLSRNYYKTTREWQYKDIEPRVFAEKYIGDGTPLLDYKFFCFNGEPLFMYIEQESSDHPTQAIMDMDFKPVGFSMEDKRAAGTPQRPKQFEQMIEYARKLSKDAAFLRVDMYLVDDIVYIGELTFYHYGGYTPFEPREWDLRLGERLDISQLQRSIK